MNVQIENFNKILQKDLIDWNLDLLVKNTSINPTRN